MEDRKTLSDRLFEAVLHNPGISMTGIVETVGEPNLSYGLGVLRKLAASGKIRIEQKLLPGSKLRIRVCWPPD